MKCFLGQTSFMEELSLFYFKIDSRQDLRNLRDIQV